MYAIDFVVVMVLAISLILGVIRGFMREAIGLLAWLGGLWLAWRYAHWLAPYMGGLLKHEPINIWVARALILIAVLLISSVIAAFLSYVARQSGLSPRLDSVLGGFFGLLRGVVLLSAIIMLAELVKIDESPWWRKSKLLPYASNVSHWVSQFAESALSSADRGKVPAAAGAKDKA